MKKQIISIVSMVSTVASAFAIPANPKPVAMTKSDGTTIMVQMEGDEYGCLYRDMEGRILTFDNNGDALVASDAEADEIEINYQSARRRGPGIHSATFTRTGNVKACVILVQFSDVKFSTENPQQYFQRWCNEEGFSDHGCAGSVRDYFRVSSAGAFTPAFDVYGPVTLSSSRSSYSSTSNAYKMATQAAKALDSTVDFSQYDVDGNGYIDNIIIIFAGQSANDGGTNSPWPHGSNAPTGLFTRTKVDGKIVEHYCCVGERNSANDKPTGPGTLIHEFGHVLGLPDLYASTQNQYTPNWWNVMDVGSYLNDGRSPLYYSAFERYALDWLQPTELTQACTVDLQPLVDTNFACIIQTGRSGDFYLLENRPKRSTGFDNYLYGDGGMLIWHIDASDSSKFATGTKPNDDSNHLRVDLIEADNEPNISTYASLANDVWPGGSNNNSFTGTSTPAMFRWNSSSGSGKTIITDKPITNIRRDSSTGLITFDYMGGSSSVVVDPIPEDGYCYIAGNSASNAERYCSSLTIADDKSANEMAISLQTMAGQALYYDNSSKVFLTEAGATITISATGSQEWIHSYIYVDWNEDGFNYSDPSDYLTSDYKIKPGVDLVYFSRWSPQGNDPADGGEWYSSADGALGSTGNVHQFNPTRVPASFTIPADTPAGTYRVRFKTHWCSLDPCGKADSNTLDRNTMASVGGVMADFTIEVSAAEPQDEVPEITEPGADCSVLYDLSGHRVLRPIKGKLYLRKVGTKSEKIFY